MRLVRVPEDPPPPRPPEVVATIGKFDGVHLGHQVLIRRVVEEAASLGVQSAVITFDPHPTLVLRPNLPLRLLSTIEDRVEVFEAMGVDNVLVWRFDRQTQHTTAERFLEQLNRRVRLRRLVHGPGFALGYRRQGTAAVLAEIGGWLGFEIEEVAPVDATGAAALAVGQPTPATLAELVTSSAVRGMVEAGEIKRATQALGRHPTLCGQVVEGEKVGRTLGFPTANLDVAGPLAVPADGVYAAWAELAPFTTRARRLPAAVSIGARPQFGGQRRVVEAYLLDFAGNLYGQHIRLHFVARLRGQERFESVDGLVAQMRRDVELVRRLLAGQAIAEDERELAADG
jgi:riboflavin kinase/FMN adenylyltransferase